ncbi:MAG: nucleotidyltransferase domain-containing protein [Promethearchaeota archaeon]
MIDIELIRKDLRALKGKYEVVLFGSQIEGSARPNSDIDIAVISRSQDSKVNLNLQNNLLGQFPIKYDIRVFELFPIDIQISIINNYIVIFGDPLEISEYFYIFRKKWDDCKYRILTNQFSSYKERLKIINSLPSKYKEL